MSTKKIASDASISLQILSNFIHQIINPLNGIVGTLENIENAITPREKVIQKVGSARGQLETSISLIRNLAFLSGVSSGVKEVSSQGKGNISVVPQVIIEAAQYFQEAGGHRGIKIHLDDAAERFKLKGHPDVLKQIFINLFDNGIKYGEVGSRIVVTTWIQKSTGDLLIQQKGRSAAFKKSEKEKIFDLGFRSDGAQRITSSGAGLGLHICRMISEEYFGGEIWAEVNENTDETEFTVRIPKENIWQQNPK